MDKLEEVMPSAEEKEIKEQEIAEEADEAAGKDNAADEEVEEEEEEAADEVEEEEKEAAGKDDAADEEEVEEEEAAGKDDAADVEEEEAAVKDDAADEEMKEEKEEADGNEQGGGDKPKGKAIPQAAKKIAKKLPWQDKPKEKRPDECLNLNNEVVRMRQEVKRVRGLIIRKLTRQMAALKKKKGKELAVESNLRRAGRLLEEIHAMKTLPTDLVSKTALQRDLNFDQVCKNPRSTISDRALARIATHPQFNKKIQDIKAAVKAFKQERVKSVKQGGKEKVQNKGVKVNLQSPDKKVEREREERGVPVEQKEDKEEGDELLKDITVAEPEKETRKASPAVGQRKEMPEPRNVRLASVKGSEVKDVVKNKPQAKQAGKKPDPKSLPQALQKKMDEEEESDLESDDEEEEDKLQAENTPDLKSEPKVLQKKRDEEEESDLESDDEEEDTSQSEKKPHVKSAPKVLQKKMDEEEESDLESDGVEKEYFDDSTEERFRKKSSQSEESDDDGFFVGKVRKFSKKKKKENSVEEDTASNWREGTGSDKVQGELDELESRLKSKATSFQSVFCSSLSSSRPGGGRGRGGDGFRGRGRQNDGGGRDRDFSKSKFQKQERESFSSGGRGRGRGRGRGDGVRPNDRRGGSGGALTQQAPEQALHPSWEASRKRKEQQGQILAFQGKKIKFDNDD